MTTRTTPPRPRTPPLSAHHNADLARPPSITGSVSGSASPSTRYGSFPPPGENGLPGKELEARLRGSLLGERGRSNLKGKGKGKLRWQRSKERMLVGTRAKPKDRQARGAALRELDEDVFDSDADLSDDFAVAPSDLRVGERDEDRSADGRPPVLVRTDSGGARLRRERSGCSRGAVSGEKEEKQWGVMQMEMMGRTWGKKGLLTMYAGIYLISALMSLEYNTTPVVEPFLLSVLGSHSLLGAVAIVTNIAYAVGKPPMSKILDVFGRAEGVALAAGLYSVGYLLAASAPDVRVFIVGRAVAALGGQGISLAQQIIIADTTTLTNRGLITSTISLPWLFTTWLGPPLGAFFQARGPRGYRAAYAVFGLLLPAVAAVLICTLMHEWRRTKLRLGSGVRRGSRSSAERGVGVDARGKEQGVRERDTWGVRIGTVWRELDVVGLASLTVGCALLLLPLTLAAARPESWGDGVTWILIAGGAISLAFCGYYESHWAGLPLLPPRLLRNRTILAGSMLGFFHFASQFCYTSFFTSFLQVARFHSPRDASYISESYLFSASISAIIAGLFAKYSQRYRWIGIAGVLIHALGTWLMMRSRNLDSSTTALVLSQVVGGVGGGFTTIAAQIGCQGVVGHQDVGIATAVFLTITTIGGAVGSAVAGSVWSIFLPSRLRQHLPPASHPLIKEIMASLPFALSFPAGSETRTAINQAYVEVQQRLNLVAIVLLVPALVAVCAMKNIQLELEDPGQGEGVVVLGRASFMETGDGLVVDSEANSLLGDTSD